MSVDVWFGLLLVAGAGAVAIAGAERGARTLVAVGKPLATASLFLVAGAPIGPFGRFIAAGLLLSLAGDVALLGGSNRWFQTGVALFLGAQLCYVAAFARMAGGLASVALGLPALASSAVLVAALWSGLGRMRAPVVVYAIALSATVLAAAGTRGGPLPPEASVAATVGAWLFYVSDAVLAWNRFRKPVPHSSYVTLGVYWLGQIGIALAARLSGAGSWL